MNRLIRRALLAMVLPAILLISGCEQGGNHDNTMIVADGSADMTLAPPELLLSSRAIVRENLVLQVTIGSIVREVRADENGDFRVVIELPENTSAQVQIKWFELIGVEEVLLAVAQKPLLVGTSASPAVLTFRSDEYNSENDFDGLAIDDDGDGFSNLSERRQGTNFADSTSRPVAAPVPVTLNVELNLPDVLAAASGTARSQLFTEAFVNGNELLISREGDVWRGQAIVTENTSPLVRVRMYATAERLIKLVDSSRNREVGSGSTIVFAASEYQDGIDPFNDDGDKFNNAEEIANETDPTNKLDPDFDGDELSFGDDNCPLISNAGQEDRDRDGLGDACDDVNDIDLDEDGVVNDDDNCPGTPNSNQANIDGDNLGDACDDSDDRDADGDGIPDIRDNCLGDANRDQADLDDDGIGDVCDSSDDRDGDIDGIPDVRDNCPTDPNPDQADMDRDLIGDACDPVDDTDTDGDRIPDFRDNCPDDANTDQDDIDGDMIGDACDPVDDTDTDGDRIPDFRDNCPFVVNPLQENLDGDQFGDICDPTPTGPVITDPDPVIVFPPVTDPPPVVDTPAPAPPQ